MGLLAPEGRHHLGRFSSRKHHVISLLESYDLTPKRRKPPLAKHAKDAKRSQILSWGRAFRTAPSQANTSRVF
jgi:hypothetical protein